MPESTHIISKLSARLLKEHDILDMDGSSVGLAITQSISLTGIFQWGMRQSAEMENQMTSVERVMEYTKLPQESSLRSVRIHLCYICTLANRYSFGDHTKYENMTY